MRCTMRNCKNTKDICPISKFCPPCDVFMKDQFKRNESQERQQTARDQLHNQNRNINASGPTPSSIPSHTNTAPTMSNDRPTSSGASVPQPPASSGPPSYNSSNYPPVDGVNPANAPLAIDINSLHNSYNQMKASNNQPPILLDMFALMLNLQSKQTENDEMRSELQHNTVRLDAVEAKIGGII